MSNRKYLYTISATLVISASIIYFSAVPTLSLLEGDQLLVKSQQDLTVNADLLLPDKMIDILELKTFRFSSVDGEIKADRNGNLIVDRALRHWIDFHLSATGEISLKEIIEIMQESIAQLVSPAKDQAEQLLQNYLDYKKDLAEYEGRETIVSQEAATIDDLYQRLDWQKRLRRQWFSKPTVESFWQLDEVVDSYALEKLSIKQSGLSLQEKHFQIERLEKGLPQELQYLKNEMEVVDKLYRQEQQMRMQGDVAQIREVRIQSVGLAATDRLEQVDMKQEDWHKKLMAYSEKKEVILRMEGLSEFEKEKNLIAYQQQYFSAKEILRLPAALALMAE